MGTRVSEVPEAVEQKTPDVRLSGLEKASILLITLGTQASASVMQHLAPEEIEAITSQIVLLKKVQPEIRKQVISECQKTLTDRTAAGGMDYAFSLLEQVVGEAKAKVLMARLTSGGSGTFRSLRSIAPAQLAHSIKNERPQVIALVLGHLSAEQSAQVVQALPEQLQGEVALRLTQMQPTDPEVIKSVDNILLQRLAVSDGPTFTEVGGNDTVVQILNNVDRSTEKNILDFLTRADEKVANAIKEKMFVFEDILALDDRSIQVILRDVPQEDLRLALRALPEREREVFYRNMSQRAAETLKEDMESSGPVKLKDVEAAQGRISNIARQLDEAGEISLRETDDTMI